jgi:two-component system, OmpR family, response regulator
MPQLLLIDDDEGLGPPLASYVRRYGFELVHATRPSLALARLREGGIDAVILDVMLPEMDGFEVCRTIRREGLTVPVLMLTARGEVMDRIVGLELGADDYLPKPFEPRELLARIQTVLRRASAPAVPPTPPAGVLRFEELTIDLDRHEVRRNTAHDSHNSPPGDAPIELTGTEFELLVMLAGQPGKVFSRDDILTRLRGHAAEDIASRAVDILVSRLRKKLEPLDPIRTLRNAGYRFVGVRR